MQCDNVIRELAVPTDDRDSSGLTEHLAQCPSCATWADRVARFDRLWEATRPAEPISDIWDTVWAHVASAVDKKEFRAHSSSLDGSAAKIENSPVPSSRSHGLRVRRLMAIGSVGIAQAAAVFLAVFLSWPPSAKSPQREVGDTSVAPSFVTTDSNMTVSTDGVVEIEEGQQVVIRIEGPVVRVVVLTPDGVPFGVDEMYLAFNEVEGIANPKVAMKE
jgi:hypothetical protein